MHVGLVSEIDEIVFSTEPAPAHLFLKYQLVNGFAYPAREIVMLSIREFCQLTGDLPYR
jgi:hypothetical protein